MIIQSTTNRVARQGRLFPEIQWTEEQKSQYEAELESTYQRCKVIFDRVQPELIKTHYRWFMAIEPDSGDYFIEQDEKVATQMCREKYPHLIPVLFRINETGACGTI